MLHWRAEKPIAKFKSTIVFRLHNRLPSLFSCLADSTGVRHLQIQKAALSLLRPNEYLQSFG